MKCASQLHAAPHSSEAENWSWAHSRHFSSRRAPYSGKWLLRWTCASAPKLWARLAAETVDGSFWAAKIVLEHPAEVHEHQVCVYTPDFRDVNEVRAVAIRIGELGFAEGVRNLWYKPDAFTRAWVYSRPGESASIYRLTPGQTFLATSPGFARLETFVQRNIERSIASLDDLRGLETRPEPPVLDELARMRAKRALDDVLGQKISPDDPRVSFLLYVFRWRIAELTDEQLGIEAQRIVEFRDTLPPTEAAERSIVTRERNRISRREQAHPGGRNRAGSLARLGNGQKAHVVAHARRWGSYVGPGDFGDGAVLCGAEGIARPALQDMDRCRACARLAEELA